MYGLHERAAEGAIGAAGAYATNSSEGLGGTKRERVGLHHVRELLEDAAQLVDGALHVLQRGRAAAHVRVLPHHQLLVLLLQPAAQQRLPAQGGIARSTLVS